MALVNPQIAMSFRPTVEYQPRNALAEYAQIQNIIGGQRQAEVAEMQLDQLRQDRDALRQIQAAIVAKGGPPDLNAAADAMIKSGRPEYMQQGMRIRETLAQQQRLEAYEREHYPTDAAAPSAVPAAAAAAPAAATEPPIPRGLTSTGSQTFDNMIADEALQNRPAPLVQGPITAEEIAAARARNAAPAATAPAAVAPAAVPAATNALAPAAAPATTNAMRAAAQPDVDALMRRYNQAARAGSPDAPAILKQIEAALRGDQNRLVTVSQGQTVIDPRTRAVIFTAPAAPTAPRIDVIGVVKNTDTPVYFDKDTRQQFTIGVDASGKQVQVPYTGAVNRSTSTVTAPVDVRVNAYVPASETAQAEYMKSTRTTFEALRNAQPTLDNIERAKALVAGAQGFMGTGGEPLLAAASFLNNRLGTSINTTGVTDAQELRSRLFFGILDNLKKLDSQPSQQQQNALQQALGSIGTDPSALPRVLDAFADSIRTKVNLYNQDVTSAEARGVKFPYKPQIQLTPPKPSGTAAAAQIPAGAPAAAAGNTVTLPNGTVMTFPNAEAAAKFKRDARLP